MRRVKSGDTTPEPIVRRALHAAGLRYKLHVKNLPGSPDLVFPKYETVIFIHGCFWHRHDCYKASDPATRTTFWNHKFRENTTRDKSNLQKLSDLKWRVLIVWECSLKGRTKLPLGLLIETAINFIKNSSEQRLEITGSN